MKPLPWDWSEQQRRFGLASNTNDNLSASAIYPDQFPSKIAETLSTPRMGAVRPANRTEV